MTDKITDAALDERLRSADPLRPSSLPSEADTEAALHRLLAVASEAGRARGAPRPRVRLPRPRLLAGTTAGAAAVATTLVLLLGAANTSPAFAVTPNRDGTVTVKILSSAGIAGANAKLSALHVRARIVQVAAGCPSGPMQGQGAPAPAGVLRLLRSRLLQARIDPRKIPPGQMLVIASSSRTADGRIQPTQEPTAPSGNSSNSGSGANSGSRCAMGGKGSARSSGNSGNSSNSGNS